MLQNVVPNRSIHSRDGRRFVEICARLRHHLKIRIVRRRNAFLPPKIDDFVHCSCLMHLSADRPCILIAEPDEYRRHKYVLDLNKAEDELIVKLFVGKKDAHRFLMRNSVDYAIVNMRLPDGNGADLIRQILKRNPLAQVLVLSNVSDDNIVTQAIQAGANGYLLFQDPSAGDLLNCLNLMRAGGSPVSPQIARTVLRALPCRAAQAESMPIDSPLSNRELEILRLIAKGISFSEMSQILAISTHTITTHVKKIYRKLGVHSRGEAVFTARQQGLL